MEELNAITRKEKFLAKAAGQDVETPEPITREEMFLSKIAGGGGGGASSWNDLKDKPFGEETVSLGDTLTFPKQTPISPTDVFVQYDVINGIKLGGLRVSDDVPSIDDFIGGSLTSRDGDTVESVEISEDFILNAVEVFAVIVGTMPFVCVALVDNATVTFQGIDFMFAKKGIYVTCSRSEQTGLNYYILQVITLPNYNFTKTAVRGIEPKYLPDGGFGYEVVKHTGGDTLTWDGEPTGTTAFGFYYPGEEVSAHISVCLVSEKVPTAEQIITGTLGVSNNGVQEYKNLAEAVVTESNGYYTVGANTGNFYVALEDGVKTDSVFAMTFPKKGIYFTSVKSDDGHSQYENSLQIPNFDFAETEIHKIDEKFLPDTVATKADIFGAMEASY